jgi:uncharacterized protein
MNNPFQFGRELGADELVDRENEVASVVTALTTGAKLFVVGPRRYGKTTILRAAGEKAHRAGHTVLRYNVEAYPAITLLVRAIVADAAGTLKGGITKSAEQIKRFFSRLKPELSYNPGENTWSVSLHTAQAQDSEDSINLLVDALHSLEKLAKATSEAGGRRVALVLDEFQRIVELGGKDAEAQFRAAVQQHKHVGYVFAGSKSRMITEMTTNAARPFYRLGKLISVLEIPRIDFAHFLAHQFTTGGFFVEGGSVDKPDAGAIAYLLDMAEQVPYNVQLLAHEAWEELRNRRQRKLTKQLIDQTLDRIVREYDLFYTQLWNSLTSTQQRVLLAVIGEGGTGLQSKKVTQTIGRTPATTKKALTALESQEILRQQESLGQVRYSFEDPFYAAWIKAFIPPLEQKP